MSRLTMLKEALELLAAPAQEQVRWMDSWEVSVDVDELVLNYTDIALSAEFMLEEAEIAEGQRDCVLRLLALVRTMGGPENPELWTQEALASTPTWEQVRHHAGECLKLFGK